MNKLVDTLKLLGLVLLLFFAVSYLAYAKTSIVAPTSFSTSSYGEWRRIEKLITSGKDTEYEIFWKGIGGWISYGEEFMEYVNQAKAMGATVRIIITGKAASTHALSICNASEVVYLNSAVLKYHSVSYTTYGGDTYRGDNSEYKYLFDRCVRAGVIDSSVYDRVQDGYEVMIRPTTGEVWYEKDERPKG